MPETVGRVAFAAIEVAAIMPRCRDCRWWEQMRERRGPDVVTEGGVCSLAEYPARSKAVATDGGEGIGVLETAHDFGCVQFEAKP